MFCAINKKMKKITSLFRKESIGRKGVTRRAITLIELTLVLALAAIVVFVALRAYNQAQANSRVQQTTALTGQVRSAVESLYSTGGTYTGLAVSQIASALPKSVLNAGQTAITNPFSGATQIGADKVATTGDSYYISQLNLDPASCTRMATVDMGRSVQAIKVDPANGGGAVALANTTVPMTQAAASSACTGTTNSVGWQFQ